MLRIIKGRIGTGKTHTVIDEIGQRINDKKKSLLIVPDPVTYNFEQRICSQLNIKGFIDVEICSFNRFASKVIDYFGQNRYSFLDDTAKAMVIRLCLLKCEDNLTIFKAASRRKSFASRCLNMISVLENCSYTPDDLLDVCKKLDDGILKYKLTDTALIYNEYINVLKTGYTDNAHKLKFASSLLKDYFQNDDTCVYIDGFDVYTTHLFDFIRELIAVTDVVITVPSAEGHSDRNAYKIHEKTLETLLNIAKEENVAYSLCSSNEFRSNKSDEIKFLEDSFYSIPTKKYEKECSDVFLDFYASPYDEVCYVAKKIAQNVRNGMRYKDHAVLCNDLEKYTPIIANVFDTYGIPVYTDKTYQITSSPIALYLFSALKCVYSSFSPENVLDYLLSGLTGLTQAEKDLFISFVRKTGITSSEMENGLYYKRTSSQEQADFDALRKQLIEPLLSFKDSLVRAKNSREMSSACYSFLESQNVLEKINDLVDQYENLGFFDLSDVTSQLWNKLLSLLESLATLSSDLPITIEEFSLTLYEGFKSSSLSTIPSVLDSVTFGDFSSVKEQKQDITYIIGANDGVVPAVYADEKLVTVYEGRLLKDLGLELQHSEETEDAITNYNIYSALCSPSKELHFSCPLYSTSGGALRPSILFKRFRQIFPMLTPTNYEALTPHNELSLPFTKEQVLNALSTDNVRSNMSKVISKYFKDSNDLDYKKVEHSIKNNDLTLSQDLAGEIFLTKETTSISRIEAYAECPFSHFITYGLIPLNEMPYSANALDLGDIFHATLEEFSKKQHRDDSKDDCYNKASEIFDKLMPDIHFGVFNATERQKVFNTHLKTLISESAWTLKEYLKDFTPIGEEISFGYGKNPPIELKTSYGTLYLKGKIDRADILNKDDKVYLRIIDYKSGNETFSEKKIDKGTKLQLTAYMSALLQKYNNSVPAGAQYMLIADDNKFEGPELNIFTESKKAYSEEQFRSLLDKTNDKMVELTENILSGNIFPTPSRNNCEYCKYINLCRTYLNGKEDSIDAEMD